MTVFLRRFVSVTLCSVVLASAHEGLAEWLVKLLDTIWKPLARLLDKGELLEKHVYSQEGHKWHRDGMSKEALQKIQDFYRERYKQ